MGYMANEQPNLIWIDCEMTGLDLENDVLVEIAVLVTDSDLNVIGEGIDLVLTATDAVLGFVGALFSIGGSGSVGSYETPAFLPKNSKNWRGGKKPIYKGGKFVRVKKKCKKFPYCNQGDKNVLELLESQDLKKAIQENAIKYNLPIKEVERLVINQIKQIFI